MSTSDVFYNDRGVCVVSNSCMRSREDAPDLTDGGIAYNLRRAVAERAESARDAVHLLMVLVRRWGYASPGRAYTVADADEAFMIQIVHGKHYAALRVPDDAVVVMPNHYTIHCPSAFSEHWTSPRLESYARSRGCARRTSPFDFARAYQHPDSRMQPVNVLRQRFSVEALTGKPCPAEGMPFVVRPAAPVTVEKLMAMLANHYEGAPEDVRVGAGRTPHGSEHPRVCDGSTVESTVFDLYHNPRLTTVWLAAGRPCQQPWLPLHPLCGLPDALAPMADPAAELARHLCPDPSRMAHGNSGWQRLRDFGNEMEAVYGDNAEAVRAALADQRVRAARADAEAVARADALFAQGRVEEASAVVGALVRAAGVRGAGDGCFAGEGFSPRAGLRSGGGGWRALARRFRGRRCGGPRARRAHSRDVCLRGHSGCGKPAARRLPDARARLLRSGASRQLCRRGGWDLHRAVRRAHGAWLCDAGRAHLLPWRTGWRWSRLYGAHSPSLR